MLDVVTVLLLDGGQGPFGVFNTSNRFLVLTLKHCLSIPLQLQSLLFFVAAMCDPSGLSHCLCEGTVNLPISLKTLSEIYISRSNVLLESTKLDGGLSNKALRLLFTFTNLLQLVAKNR
jgi:hypothetical protein